MQTQELELGYLAIPDATPAPGVVMIPDVWGLKDLYKDFARRLAGEGFAVLAVDLYTRGESITDPAQVTDFIRSLPDPQVVGDLQAAVDALASHEAVAGRPVGITGFCMGGQYALLAACGCSGLSACVPFYGMITYEEGLDPARKPRSPLEAIPDLTCPVLGLYGAEDHLIPVADVRALEEAIAKTPHTGETVLYDGAGHAFLNELREEAYRPEAARDAWPRMVAFFRERLG